MWKCGGRKRRERGFIGEEFWECAGNVVDRVCQDVGYGWSEKSRGGGRNPGI